MIWFLRGCSSCCMMVLYCLKLPRFIADAVAKKTGGESKMQVLGPPLWAG